MSLASIQAAAEPPPNVPNETVYCKKISNCHGIGISIGIIMSLFTVIVSNRGINPLINAPENEQRATA